MDMDSNSLNQQVRPPLHTSCLIGDEEAVLSLLATPSGKADINETDFSGCSCLQLASAAGHLNIVKILLENGAKPEKQDSSHANTCLHEASWRGYSRLVKILSNKDTINRQNNGGFTPLHLSCQAGHNQSTRELLLAGADPNLVNTYGDTALHTAVRYGHAGVARILLSARAAGDVQNKNGDTSLHISAAMGRKKLTKILLSAGCRQNIKNHQRETALDISIRKAFDEVTQCLQNPPKILTPMQRDEMRASKAKYKTGDGEAVNGESRNKSKSRNSKDKSKDGDEKRSNSKDGNGSGASGRKTRGSGTNSKQSSSKSKESPSHSRSSNNEPTTPSWSPYGCHYHPNPSAFPPPNIDSLPKEPLTSGELYYLDLAGNIHKGPMGISEGCYCTPILKPAIHSIESPAQCAKNCQDQLKTLTNQLSKIHLDTQAQLSSLHSMLNEKLTLRDNYPQLSYNETKLKEWVKQYRRFRKELSKNPKALVQANELLENASALMLTRPASPPVEGSDSDSGL